MPRAFGDKRKLTPAAHAQYLAPLADPDRTASMVFPKRIVAATPWLGTLWGGIGRLRDKPVQIVWGMKDIAFREQELRRWEQAFPQARTLRLAGVGHYVQEEAPTELGAAVDAFLAETAAVSGDPARRHKEQRCGRQPGQAKGRPVPAGGWAAAMFGCARRSTIASSACQLKQHIGDQHQE